MTEDASSCLQGVLKHLTLFIQLCIGSPLLKHLCDFITVSNHGYSNDFGKLSEQPQCAPPWIGEKIHIVLAILPQATTSLNNLVYVRLSK